MEIKPYFIDPPAGVEYSFRNWIQIIATSIIWMKIGGYSISKQTRVRLIVKKIEICLRFWLLEFESYLKFVAWILEFNVDRPFRTTSSYLGFTECIPGRNPKLLAPYSTDCVAVCTNGRWFFGRFCLVSFCGVVTKNVDVWTLRCGISPSEICSNDVPRLACQKGPGNIWANTSPLG